MFNPVTTWQDDTEYRISFLNQKAKISSDQRLDLQMYRSFITKMLALKLDPTLDVLLGLYPDTGRPAKNQSQIIRSCILFTFLFGKNMASFSLTAWVRSVLPINLTISISAPASCRHSFLAVLEGESYKSAQPPGREYS